MLTLRLLRRLRRRANEFVLDIDMNLPLREGHAVFFGPSGSGKSMSMQCIAGLVAPDEGRIVFNGVVMLDSARGVNRPARMRKVGYLPQDYALFPHLTVMQNVAYAGSGCFGRHVGNELRRKSLALLDSFGIAHLAANYPEEISGGQKQRAALARAVNAGPDLLLLDEPFSALDPLLREHMRAEMLALLNQIGIPAVIISHEPEDVDAFAGSLALFHGGRSIEVPNWRERRAAFPDAAACLRMLQKEAFGR